jgi:hypothetical protein
MDWIAVSFHTHGRIHFYFLVSIFGDKPLSNDWVNLQTYSLQLLLSSHNTFKREFGLMLYNITFQSSMSPSIHQSMIWYTQQLTFGNNFLGKAGTSHNCRKQQCCYSEVLINWQHSWMELLMALYRHLLTSWCSWLISLVEYLLSVDSYLFIFSRTWMFLLNHEADQCPQKHTTGFQPWSHQSNPHLHNPI